jgi:hypothetical protein
MACDRRVRGALADGVGRSDCIKGMMAWRFSVLA